MNKIDINNVTISISQNIRQIFKGLIKTYLSIYLGIFIFLDYLQSWLIMINCLTGLEIF